MVKLRKFVKPYRFFWKFDQFVIKPYRFFWKFYHFVLIPKFVRYYRFFFLQMLVFFGKTTEIGSSQLFFLNMGLFLVKLLKFVRPYQFCWKCYQFVGKTTKIFALLPILDKTYRTKKIWSVRYSVPPTEFLNFEYFWQNYRNFLLASNILENFTNLLVILPTFAPIFLKKCWYNLCGYTDLKT